MPKGAEEAPNKAAPVQQQKQQKQPEITGGSAQRKGGRAATVQRLGRE